MSGLLSALTALRVSRGEPSLSEQSGCVASFYDVIVIGGGAAGLMCAYTAAARGRRVLVLDHANRIGKKILMSGGGRCNFTNLEVKPSHYLSANPHFCKSALSRFTPGDFIALVEQHGIAYYEKSQGQLFCVNKAKDIVEMLESLCTTYGVTILTSCHLQSLQALQSLQTQESPQAQPRADEQGFVCVTSAGRFSASSVVVATGGKSIPTLGATGLGYELAVQFGLAVTALDAALVPFVLTDQSAEWQSLSGISCQATVSCNGASFTDGLLFTHRGLSGPAILQISNYWHPGMPLQINLLPGVSLAALFAQWRQQKLKQTLKNALADRLPKRLLEIWLAGEIQSVLDYSNNDIEALSQRLQAWTLTPASTEGNRTAEVTRGGVSTDEVSSKTFESKKQPGLYFVGEVLDVTGHLGGYNFQWAWASGYCAGCYV